MTVILFLSCSQSENKDEPDSPEFAADPLEAEPFKVGPSTVTSGAESESLQAAYEAAQREIESLKAQIAALKIHQFGLERFPFRKSKGLFSPRFPRLRIS